MKEYQVISTKLRRGNKASDAIKCITETQEQAESYLHGYIVARIDIQDRFINVSDDKSTYYDKDGNITYQRPEGYQCGAPFWFDEWNLEMFRIYEGKNA